MWRVALIFFTLSQLVLAGGYWDSEFEIKLQKDEIKEFKIFDRVREKSLFFHWTLYINRGMVVIANYDGYPRQYILYKDYNRNSFQIPLYKPRSALMVEFADFKEDNKTAKFRVLFKNSSAELVEKEPF